MPRTLWTVTAPAAHAACASLADATALAAAWRPGMPLDWQPAADAEQLAPGAVLVLRDAATGLVIARYDLGGPAA